MKLALALLFSAAAASASPIAYPGSVWMNASRDFSGLEGTGVQGHVQQGIDFVRIPGDWTLGAYGGWGGRSRSLNNQYFDEAGPYLGASVRGHHLELGADGGWQSYPFLGRTDTVFTPFGTWYYDKDLRPSGSRFGLPFATWGRVEYAANTVGGAGTLGWVQQGIEWLEFPGKVKLETFGEYAWRVRENNRTYYNVHGPGLGVRLTHKGASLGLEYSWQDYPALGTESKSLRLFFIVYQDWDLKPKS